MIPAIMIWLFKKYASQQRVAQLECLMLTLKKCAFMPVLVVLLMFLPINSRAQETQASYTILHNGKIIGAMQFSQKTLGEDVYLKLSSQVQTRFVVEVNVNTLDHSHFKAGKLLSSSVFRKVNGKEKPCKKTKLINDNYQLLTGNRQQHLREAITYNMSLLYIQEPVRINSVYSDSFQQFLAIKKIAQNKYRIDLPDGNYNEYIFKNGICNQVWVHHTLYTIEMKLNALTS
ncbi:MAG: hypothetical protein EOP00_16235 [Pedobacter sp.]|nr:MAG: hypothetical protein EOP00_16235 [Pedobacter sp.]